MSPVLTLNYGDKNVTNQLFCYNTTTNAFEWPFNGILSPLATPRSGHSSLLHGNAVFIFGGMDAYYTLKNELLAMDLETQRMKQIHPDITAGGIPAKRFHHTLTKTSTGRAILYGGFGSYGGPLQSGSAVGDCWILHTEKMLTGTIFQPSEVWSKVETSSELKSRYAHIAIIDPQSDRLNLLGGGFYARDGWKPSSKMHVVSLTTAPLELLAMERIIERYDAGDPELDEFLPKDHPFRKTLEARRKTSALEHRVNISWIERRELKDEAMQPMSKTELT